MGMGYFMLLTKTCLAAAVTTLFLSFAVADAVGVPGVQQAQQAFLEFEVNRVNEQRKQKSHEDEGPCDSYRKIEKEKRVYGLSAYSIPGYFNSVAGYGFTTLSCRDTGMSQVFGTCSWYGGSCDYSSSADGICMCPMGQCWKSEYFTCRDVANGKLLDEEKLARTIRSLINDPNILISSDQSEWSEKLEGWSKEWTKNNGGVAENQKTWFDFIKELINANKILQKSLKRTNEEKESANDDAVEEQAANEVVEGLAKRTLRIDRKKLGIVKDPYVSLPEFIGEPWKVMPADEKAEEVVKAYYQEDVSTKTALRTDDIHEIEG